MMEIFLTIDPVAWGFIAGFYAGTFITWAVMKKAIPKKETASVID